MKVLLLLMGLSLTISSLVQINKGGFMTDNNGNQYPITEVNGREWVLVPIRTTVFRNGDEIPNVTVQHKWTAAGDDKTPALCTYNNEPLSDSATFLYNWFAASDPRGIAPLGWSLPTLAELDELSKHLNNKNVTLSMGGIRDWLGKGSGAEDFDEAGKYGVFWSYEDCSSLPNCVPEFNGGALWYTNAGEKIEPSGSGKGNGLSIILIKDI